MWDWKKTIILLIPVALLAAGVLLAVLLRGTLRTRMQMEKQLRDDPDINEWLVVFGWSRKILYVPTILYSLIACGLMLLKQHGLLGQLNEAAVGGIWIALFILNFLVDEYEISIKVLLIVVLFALALFLWLHFLGWVVSFLHFFRRFGTNIGWQGYLVIALLFASAAAISWIKGLFYYVAITPNYLNIQTGPTETGEQVSREEYSTRIDTGDFLERLLGFGRIIITFSDQRRQPILLLVGRIGKRAARLESIRGKLAVDRHQASREG